MNSIRIVDRGRSRFHNPSWKWTCPDENQNKVLSIIFGNLSYSSLCKCCLVSKPWRKLALEEIQNRCTVTIKNQDQVRFILQKLHSCNSNFRIGKSIISCLSMDRSIMKRFFIGTSQTLNVLQLEGHLTSRPTFLLQALYNLPNLTKLSVNLATNPGESRVNQDFTFLTANSSNPTVSSSFQFIHPNIRYLHLDIGPVPDCFQLSKVFHTFPRLIELSISNLGDEPRKNFTSIPPVKSLSIRQYSTFPFSSKLVASLTKLDFRLTNLVLIFHPPLKCPLHESASIGDAVKSFIHSQQSSLQRLKLIQVEDDICIDSSSGQTSIASLLELQDSSNYSWNFNFSLSHIPVLPLNLPQLRSLHVQKPFISNLAQVLKHFPSLVELQVCVSSSGANWQGMVPHRMEPHSGIATLKVDYIDSDSFARVVPFFPRLQVLHLSHSNDNLVQMLKRHVPSFNVNLGRKRLTCEICRLNESETEQDGDGGSKSSFVLKNLRLLTIRPCHHASYENFVFLQDEETSGSTCQDDIQKFTGSEDELVSVSGFSWKAAGIMRDQVFAELPDPDTDTVDTCSTA